MKNNISSFGVGFLFAIGLGLSGMTDPQKVLGFLNIFGKWDPSLLFVMIGAISVHAIAYRFIIKRAHPAFSVHWHLPPRSQITRSLVLGSVIFGIGWGLAGYCPGPALVSMASLRLSPSIFGIGMLAGMFLFRYIDGKLNIKR